MYIYHDTHSQEQFNEKIMDHKDSSNKNTANLVDLFPYGGNYPKYGL